MPRIHDLTGNKFGRLLVISKAPSKGKNSVWHCLCDCGKEVDVRADCLMSGASQSCGCLCREKSGERVKQIKPHTIHGKSNTRLWAIWMGMKARCYNPNVEKFKNYGSRGIKICDGWLSDFKSFYDWAVENGYDDSLSIERINVDGDYCPDNCTWIPMSEQRLNKTNSHFVTINGETKILHEWLKITGVPPWVFYKRVNDGWPEELAATKEYRKG